MVGVYSPTLSQRFNPNKKKGGGVEKVVAILKGEGYNKFRGSFYTVLSSFSHIEGAECKKFPLLKEGTQKALPFLAGVGQRFLIRNCPHFVTPRPCY